MSEPLNEIIKRYQNDRQYIIDRQKERNDLYKLSVNNYLRSINNEINTIQKTEEISQNRNKEFKDQIQSLYLRYETGTERLRMAMQKTLQEKMNYNSYLIKVYPKEYQDQKKKMENENEQLRNRITQLKQSNNAFDYRLQQVLNNQQQTNKTQNEEIKNKIDRITEPLIRDTEQYYQKHPEYKPYNYHGTQDKPQMSAQNFDIPQSLPTSAVKNSRSPIKQAPHQSTKEDYLEEFLISNQGNQGK